MSNEDRIRWERKHEASAEHASAPGVAGIPRAAAGAIALDLACGKGRNCEALLAAGYRVIATDIAINALRALARRYAGEPHPPQPVCCDLEDWPFAPQSFDLVLQYDFLERALIDRIRDSLRPGGHVVIDTFRQSSDGNYASGPSNPAYRLADGELESWFEDWETIEASTSDSPTARARIVARKPR